MKKLIYGLGAIAATVTPVVAVISCGKSETSNSTVAKATIEFVAHDTTPAATLKGWWGTTRTAHDFDRTSIIYEKDSDSLKAVLTAAGVNAVVEKPLVDALNKVEAQLRLALSTYNDPAYAGLVEVEKEQLQPGRTDNVLSVGTYKTTAAATADDHVEISLNGISKDLVIKFFNNVKVTGLDATATKVWEALKQAIK